ncbi:sel1 repeat family protein [Streptomyces sp. NPDC127066]|uniref:tetratricopeptide repeat protein n=1 Tax=Streptomyces sp. NPDC127066 TaxID=3347125 RepID=UPI003669B305
MTTAVEGRTSLLAVVRGKSCTGKTRTAAEAVKAVVPGGSPLLFPADAEGLLAALDADVLGPGSVLWLNEAQDYLTDPVGETVAAALLRRLDAEDPLLVIATLWPDYDQTLTTLPSPGSDDPHRQARALLAQTQYTYLPGSFADDMDAVRDAAGTDASLTAVLESAGVDLTQALAAGPDLVTHYEHPAGQDGNYGKALISAAMDAHRLGITTPLPLDFLRHAAAGYLTGSERAADPVSWFPGALAYAQTLIKHTIRPLQNVPHPSGMGALPGRVRLADYLQQHGRHTRRHLCPPADFWDAAAHLDHADDLFQLAFAARLRHRLQWARRLYLRAAQAGSVPALSHLASWATEPQEAEELLRQAFRAGDTGALLQLGRLRENAHDAAGAEGFYHQAITAGDSTGYAFLAAMRERTGDLKEAERLYKLAIRHGAIGCLSSLAHLHDSADNLEVAAQLYRKAIDAGATGWLVLLARLHHEAGEQNAAEACYQEAIDVGEGDDLVHLAEMYSRIGHYDEATAVIERAAEAGVLSALVLTAHPHDVTATRSLYRKALAAGDDTALTLLGKIREHLDDHDRAEHLYIQAANCGSQQRQFYVRWPYGLEPDGTPTPAH